MLFRSLVKDSDLILLDEPLANLDFKLREELREELPKLFKDRDCIVVYATTEPSDALLIGGYTATLLEGKIIQHGKTGYLSNPDDKETLLYYANIIEKINRKNCREWVEKNASADIFANKVVNWLNKVITEYK